MSPEKYCEDKTRGAGSSFFYAFLFLSPEKRRAMMALYAFCREVDDIADEIKEKEVAIRKLVFWQEEVERVFSGVARHPVGIELMWTIEHYPIEKTMLTEMIEGMLMDVSGKPMVTDEDLDLYCYRVAGVVGLMSIAVFGFTQEASKDFALKMGNALQLTNILRDVYEDTKIERIYLPQQTRAKFKVTDQDIRQGFGDNAQANANLKDLLQHYFDKAEQCYADALAALPAEDRQSLTPSLMMGAIYYAHLAKLKKVDFDVW
ncbi:MAG TPA: squalene synthase HpnD, partial [Ghiorsea sp.]|nr:squalene synthase HpnD [Ghiorsea sp.]